MKSIIFTLLWSLLGVALIFTGHHFSNRGFITTIPPYVFVMIASMFFYKPDVNSFKLYFFYGFSIFMMIGVFSLIYILSFDNHAAIGVPFSHWLKVFGMLLAIGIPSAALLAGSTYFIKKKLGINSSTK